MNVTYLIGNGFDLGIGLKTSYIDFLKSYIETPSSSKAIEEFKSTIKKETIDLWSDFEVSFGKYIANFSVDTIDDYISIYEDVLTELNKYLITENNRFPDDIDEIKYKKFVNWLRLADLDKIGFRPSVKDRFSSLTQYNRSTNSVIYDFLSFNYTNTLDKIIIKIRELNKGVLHSFTSLNGTATREVNSIVHVHGELNGNMLTGVNDSSQLPFSHDLPDKIKRRLIKPEKNRDIGYNIDTQAKDIIKNSNIICIYGMSIGATDTVWWKRIGKWLLEDKTRVLIYFVHDGKIDSNPVYGIDRIRDAEEDYCNKLFDAIEIPHDKRTEIRNKVFVIINSEFMQIRLVTGDRSNDTISTETQPQMSL